MAGFLKLHDEMLDFENSLESDMEQLANLRNKMYAEKDLFQLKLTIPVLNAILYDVEKYKGWVEEQIN